MSVKQSVKQRGKPSVKPRRAYTRKRLLRDAKRMGCRRWVEGSLTYLAAVGRKNATVRLYADGTIHQADVPVQHARRMSPREAAKLLGLEVALKRHDEQGRRRAA